ncbi:L-histidine N(alpha)-methyltransferase [Dactylosporangium sp. CS-047395]|uniref:L-histidine N(alpha)-methyltransferase n=1 Tax=Dactylosporangium sp. CS-047395 TaxID=3239936 RepID=UPI003D91CE66
MTLTSDDLDRIAAELAETGEIDSRWVYMAEGAEFWDRYVTWQEGDATPNLTGTALDLLRAAHDDLIAPLTGPVRVLDLGPGNGIPARGVLERLATAGRLERYIGIDASAEMFAIAERNLRTWLGPDIPLEFHRRNFTADPLTDLRGPATLALLIGGTLLNCTDPVAVLRHARTAADVIVHGARVDTVTNRTFFRFSPTETGEDIPDRHRALLDRLGVPRSHYEPEIGYDDTTRQRYLRIHVTCPVTVADRLTLPAGRRVLLWRYHHLAADEHIAMLEAAGWTKLTARLTPDGEFLLLAGRAG